MTLGLTAAAVVTDAAIHKNIVQCARPSDLALCNTTLIISNEEMNDVIKINNSLEESGLLTKSNSETIKNEAKQQKGGFLSMLSGTLGASQLGKLSTGKGVQRPGKIPGQGVMRAGEGTIRAGQDF